MTPEQLKQIKLLRSRYEADIVELRQWAAARVNDCQQDGLYDIAGQLDDAVDDIVCLLDDCDDTVPDNVAP